MAAISISLYSPLFLVLVFLTLAHAFGFSTDLIHRDTPQSPFYNPSSTKKDRLNDAIKRSFSRAAHLKQSHSRSPNTIQSQIIPASGEYLMSVYIGTPPFNILAIADTGSDLTWTQCKPCTDCYKQNAPIFDPRKSSTYRELSCGSQACQSLDASTCYNATCQYSMNYGDRSYSVGTLAAETFTMGSTSGQPVSLHEVTFGCGHDNAGTFIETATGIIGLGGGPVSLVSQLGDSINGKFSYCLLGFDNETVTSKINFGDSAVVNGSKVVSTPIVQAGIDTFYYITLESITIEKTNLTYETKMKSSDDYGDGNFFTQQGNIIIDSGTTLTFLPGDMYQKLESELRKVIKADPVEDPQGFLGLCYSDSGSVDLPKMSFKFTGAELELPPTSTFVQNGDLVCLAMVPSDEIAIFGNLSQMNFLIGYDLVNKQLSFMPADCTKY